MIELNKMTKIEAKPDAIMNKMNNQEKRGHSCNEVGIVEGAEYKSVDNLGLSHEGAYQVDEVSTLMVIEVITSSPTITYQPTTHLP